MFVRFIGETETWVCFGFCVYLSMPALNTQPLSICTPYIFLPTGAQFRGFFTAERAETERPEELSKMNSSCHPGWAFFRAGIAISFNCPGVTVTV